jgi:hypothetical protein
LPYPDFVIKFTSSRHGLRARALPPCCRSKDSTYRITYLSNSATSQRSSFAWLSQGFGCPRREDLLALRIRPTRDRGWLLSPYLYKTRFSTAPSLDPGFFFRAAMGEPAKWTF